MQPKHCLLSFHPTQSLSRPTSYFQLSSGHLPQSVIPHNLHKLHHQHPTFLVEFGTAYHCHNICDFDILLPLPCTLNHVDLHACDEIFKEQTRKLRLNYTIFHDAIADYMVVIDNTKVDITQEYARMKTLFFGDSGTVPRNTPPSCNTGETVSR
jgi:hypothetical protein